MIEKQLSLFLVNKPGVLADVCQTLGEHKINIRGISVSDTVDHAVVRLVVDDPQKAIHILGEHGVLVVETDILALEVADQPGALAKVARKFARGKINIEYAYGTADSGKIFLRVSDVKKGQQLLSDAAPKRRKKT
ncbi:MAG: ACT domain-containing protein [Pirellulaceae bacterium]